MKNKLPIHGQPGAADSDAASCGPKVYVTQEEQAILAALRELRERAEAVRSRLAEETDRNDRQALERALEQLRGERQELVQRREDAYRRKMIMLGHIEPDLMDL
jgi:hypothetical protein